MFVVTLVTNELAYLVELNRR